MRLHNTSLKQLNVKMRCITFAPSKESEPLTEST